jgi:PPP family 3-phenylpropionic acid transporter
MLAGLLRTRLAFAFIAAFVALGAWMPYWSLWLEDHGCTKAQLGLLSTTAIIVRVLTTPAVLARAELRRRRRGALIGFALAGAGVMIALRTHEAFWWYLVMHVLIGFVHPPQIPLLDAMTIRAVHTDPRVRYASVRTAGSIAFLLTALGLGTLVEHHGLDVAYWTIVGGLLLTAIAGYALPDVDTELDGEPQPSSRSPLRDLLRRRDVLVLLFASGLTQGSHAAYYAYGSVHWRSAGIDESTIGWLWAEAVFAEILLFAFGSKLAERLGARRLIFLGALASVVRWIGFGSTTTTAWLFALNQLHALSFAATHLGAMAWLAKNVSRRQAATAQGLLSALSTGLAMALATALSSWLYSSHGVGWTFAAMTVIAALGAVAALRLNAAPTAR